MQIISLITFSVFIMASVSNCSHTSALIQSFNGSIEESLKAVEDKVRQKYQDPKYEALKFLKYYKENTQQGKYTIIVSKNSEDCYFIANLKPEQILAIDFVVSTGYYFIMKMQKRWQHL